MMGSLWFAVVLIVLLLVAMASATVFEVMHGTEQTLIHFYGAWWFGGLLFLLGINVFCSLVVRYPFSRRQIGFVVTHASILLVLLGAFITRQFGIDGQVTILEGQTAKEFDVRQEVIAAVNRSEHQSSMVQLDPALTGSLLAVDHPPVAQMQLGKVDVRTLKFVPDSNSVPRVVDDNPTSRPAVEVSLSEDGRSNPVWVLANPGPEMESDIIRFCTAANRTELDRLLARGTATKPASIGFIKIAYQKLVYEISVDESFKVPMKIGQTGLTVRTLRYMPHATVGADKRVTNASEEPINPAIEVEIAGPGVNEKRLCFSQFPEFSSMHQKKNAIPGLSVVFVRPTGVEPALPIEVIGGPGKDLYVRFSNGGVSSGWKQVTLGTPIDTPWAGQKFAVLRRFERARMDWGVVPVSPTRKDRRPALLLEVKTSHTTQELWLQKDMPRSVVLDGCQYEFIYSNKVIPLGFDLTLDEFQVGYYPGGSHPRSFESRITITDPATGKSLSRVISMNNPVTFKGYSFYQSSYQRGDGRDASVLSVAWDPGKPVVFTGYITMMIGVLLVGVARFGKKGAVE